VARDANERPLASPPCASMRWMQAFPCAWCRGPVRRAGFCTKIWTLTCSRVPAKKTTAANPYAERNDEEQIPVIGMRRKIAQRMQDATRRAAHFSYVEEIDVTALDELRVHLNEKHGATRGKLTLLPFIVRAMVVALRDFPQINARYDDEAQVITRLGAVHVGVATQQRMWA